MPPRLALLIAAAALLGAAGPALATPPLRDSAWRNEDGLPQATVSAVEQQADGHVLVATEAGVARFDGLTFELLDMPDTLPCIAARDLATRADGDLDVAFACGVVRLRGRRVVAPVLRAAPGHDLVRLARAGDGALWAATTRGVERLEPSRLHVDELGETPASCIERAADGGLWAGTDTTLARIDPEGRVSGRVEASVLALAVAPDGVWVGTPDGLRWKGAGALARVDAFAPLEGRAVGALLREADGVLWIGLREGGVYHLDAAGLHAAPAPANDWVLSFKRDASGGMLFGTASDGLHRLRAAPFVALDLGDASADPVWSIARGAGDELWVGTRSGLSHVAGPKITSLRAGQKGLPGSVLSVLAARDGTVWAGTREGLAAISGDSVRIYREVDGLPDRFIGPMVEDEGGVWVGTRSGLSRRVGDRFEPRAPHGARVYALLEEPGGALWVGTATGLHRVATGQPPVRLGRADGLADDSVLSLHATSWGMLAGTSDGISLVRDGKVVRSLPPAAGAGSDEILGMEEDGLGHVWFATDSGPFVIETRELRDYLEGRLPAVHRRTFGVGDGMLNTECNGATGAASFVRTADGALLIPTMKGISRVNPADIGPRAAAPHAVLEQVRLDEGAGEAPGVAAIRLDPGARDVTFEYSGASLDLPKRIRFVPFLEGYDRVPPPPSEARLARYTNLPVGEYRFRVRACDLAELCEELGPTALVSVPPRWLERRPVQIGLSGLVVAAALGAFAGGTRALRRRAAELQRRVAERTLDLQEALEESARSQASFEAVLEKLPLAIFVLHAGVVRYANAGACRLLRASREQLLGTTPAPELAAGPNVALTTLDGKALVAEVWVTETTFDGVPATMAIARDVTEERQLEARVAIGERLVGLGTLAAGIAHEINNPLAYVSANVDHVRAELGSGRPPGADVRAALDEAADGARRIATIVREMTVLSRADDGTIEAVDLSALVESTLSVLAAEVRPRAGVVRDLGTTRRARGNRTRLGQVLLNLVTNAAHAIPPGHPEQNSITLRTREAEGGRVALEVCDTGTGIPPEHLPRLFDPFFTTKPPGVGTGLGLSICHGIVHQLGGEIAVESKVGRGTTFTVTLPGWTEATGVAAATVPPPTPRDDRRTDADRRKVLIIDDNPMVSRALARSIGPSHDTVVRDSAAVALRELEAGARYDLILCDVMMPELNGVDFYRALARELPEVVGSVVFVTGGIASPETAAFFESVPVPRLSKPFTRAQLAEVLAGAKARRGA